TWHVHIARGTGVMRREPPHRLRRQELPTGSADSFQALPAHCSRDAAGAAPAREPWSRTTLGARALLLHRENQRMTTNKYRRMSVEPGRKHVERRLHQATVWLFVLTAYAMLLAASASDLGQSSVSYWVSGAVAVVGCVLVA